MNNLQAQGSWNSGLQNNYGTPSISLSRGVGANVWDVEGNQYLDFLGGIATNILGHAHPRIVAAISEQAGQLGHVSNLYSHPRALELAQKLNSFTGEKSARTFFCNSGAEANEAAFKLSRLTGRTKIISTIGSFHGRTMGALSITGQSAKQKPFKPLLKKIKFIPYNDLAAAKRAINRKVAMIIVEPIQGENGVVVPDFGYLHALRELTAKHGVLLALDCVQTGMGRTGEWFGYEKEGIVPDIITLAKGLGGGLPLGAMIAIGECATYFEPGSHGSTFGGNPIACASAIAAISVLEEDGLLARNVKLELTLKLELSKNPIVESVRGSGLLLGIVLKNPVAKQFVIQLQTGGVLANATSDSVIRIAPPLVVTDQQITEFIKTFREVAVTHER
ncbi:MAG: acetylornithine transaminase [Actinobacteria bacterium]|nr:acetylornithine transaminase [Actinomycetota bacterium]